MWNRKTRRDRKQNVVSRGWGKGNRELLFHGDRVSVLQDERVLEMAGGDGCTTV